MGIETASLFLIDSVEECVRFIAWLNSDRGRDFIAVDTETSGLGVHTGDYIRLIQIGDSDTGWAIPWEQWGGVAIEALRNYSGKVIMHNAPFDWSLIDNAVPGLISWSQVEDTQTLAWITDPLKSVALKSLCDRWIDPRASKMQAGLSDAMSTHRWTWATVPIDFKLYWIYGALDVVLTARIWDYLQPTLRHPDRKRAYELEMAVLPIICKMQKRGAPVDVPYALMQKEKFAQEGEELRSWCTRVHGISASANVQVTRRLLEIGAELTERTPGGAFKFDKDVKNTLLVTGNPEVKELVGACKKIAQLTKLSSTYLDKIINDSVNGIIHGSINPIGASEGSGSAIKTGRMSITNPALQTLPKSAKGNSAAIEVRNCFIPSSAEHSLAMCDFAQVEFRLMAHFSGDPGLIEIFQDADRDAFTEMASQIYGEPIDRDDPRRSTMKNSVYAGNYGAGVAKFSWTAGITEEEGREFMAAQNARFPGIEAHKKRLETVGRQRLKDEGQPYVVTPFGTRLACEPDKIYKLGNYLLQGFSANIMKRKLIDMDNAGIGEYITLVVHDEVVIDAPTKDIAEIGKIAQDTMTDYNMIKVPILAELEGPFKRWGSKYEKKKD